MSLRKPYCWELVNGRTRECFEGLGLEYKIKLTYFNTIILFNIKIIWWEGVG
jgi:hypothetical protein